MSEIELLKGDCLGLMEFIPDKSIDLVLTDPPYGTTSCKWDTIIPFGPMWEQLKRITKDNGAICLFGSEPFSSHLRMSNISNYKYEWYMKKNTTADFTQAKRKPQNYLENIMVFSYVKLGKTIYFPQGLTDVSINAHTTKGNGVYQSGKTKKYKQTKGNYPRTIVEADTAYKRGTKKYHHTQKPVALLEYMIKTYTLENETVLDFTMGSGSTGVACKNLNRNFIGIEQDEKFFETAKERINGKNS